MSSQRSGRLKLLTTLVVIACLSGVFMLTITPVHAASIAPISHYVIPLAVHGGGCNSYQGVETCISLQGSTLIADANISSSSCPNSVTITIFWTDGTGGSEYPLGHTQGSGCGDISGPSVNIDLGTPAAYFASADTDTTPSVNSRTQFV